jgi:adenylate cyclase class 2
MIEVELKYPMDVLKPLRETFVSMGAQSVSVFEQSDEYFNDPLRDFEKLDCALRIRRSDAGYVLTYKGPGMDETAKIRQEIEATFVDANEANQAAQLFEAIGFVSVARVVKCREEMMLEWRGRNVHICLDEVEEVGGFVELELVVESSDESEQAKATLLSLAESVGLQTPIRTSYLTLLLKRRGQI